MLFKRRDWKQFLSVDDEDTLNKFLKEISKYRGAYRNSDEIKIAQLWCAILELRKENLNLQKRLDFFESIFESLFEKVKEQEKEKRELLKSLERF